MRLIDSARTWFADRVGSGLLPASHGDDGALPAPPGEAQRRAYLEPGHPLLRFAPTFLGTILSGGLLVFSVSRPWMLVFVPWLAFATLHWILSGWVMTTHRPFDLRAHDARVASSRRSGAAPSVDVFLPNCGEALEILENTFAHVSRLCHDGPLRILCLDDAGRTEVARLARRYGFDYLSRPDLGWFAKAGNLRYGYTHSDGDFIVVFDADFCPRPDFLGQLLPYALDDPGVGIVQSAQYFALGRSQNWLQNGAANVLDSFYRLVLPSRDGRGCPICVGTNALYRRAALDIIGGTALVQFSEDVHTGFDLLCVGYRTKYVPLVLAQGLCPDTFGGLISQQYRWCKGATLLGLSAKLWRSPLSRRDRAVFFTGLSHHVYSGFGVVLLPLAGAAMVWLYPRHFHWWSALLFVPIVYQLVSITGLGRANPVSLSGLRASRLISWAHLSALCDLVRGHSLPWTATGSAAGRGSKRGAQVRAAAVAWGIASGSALIVGALVHMPHPGAVYFWPVIVFGFLNLATSLGLLVPLRTRGPRPGHPPSERDTDRAQTLVEAGRPDGLPEPLRSGLTVLGGDVAAP